MHRPKILPFAVFAAIGFTPVLAMSCNWLLAALFASDRGGPVPATLGLAFLPLVWLGLAHRVFATCRTWKARTFVVYLAWLPLAFVALLPLAGAAGCLPEIAQGRLGGPACGRVGESLLTAAAYLTTWAQILLVPWSIVSVAILRLIDRQRRFWPASAPEAFHPPPS
jgi:hypothetical protein